MEHDLSLQENGCKIAQKAVANAQKALLKC